MAVHGVRKPDKAPAMGAKPRSWGRKDDHRSGGSRLCVGRVHKLLAFHPAARQGQKNGGGGEDVSKSFDHDQHFTIEFRFSTDLRADRARKRTLFFFSPVQGSHTPAKNPPCALLSACLLHSRITGQDEQISSIIRNESMSGITSCVQGRSWWCWHSAFCIHSGSGCFGITPRLVNV